MGAPAITPAGPACRRGVGRPPPTAACLPREPVAAPSSHAGAAGLVQPTAGTPRCRGAGCAERARRLPGPRRAGRQSDRVPPAPRSAPEVRAWLRVPVTHWAMAAAVRAGATRKEHEELSAARQVRDVRLPAPQETHHDTGQSEGRGGAMPHTIGSLRRLLYHLRANGPAHPRGQMCRAPSSRWHRECPRRVPEDCVSDLAGRTLPPAGAGSRVCKKRRPWAWCSPKGVIPVRPHLTTDQAHWRT